VTGLRIKIAVGGRFHADKMMQVLAAQGHDVRLVTSFPSSRFPAIAPDRITSFLFPEIAFRLAIKAGLAPWGERFKVIQFGRRLAAHLAKQKIPPDVLLSWSSFALESFRLKGPNKKILMRDSSHISEQLSLLRDECRKWSVPFQVPRGIEDRELEEYQLADKVLVLSDFARRSFLNRGFSPERLQLLRLGVDASRFEPALDWKLGNPLRVIYFGSISTRKGIPYLLEATSPFSPRELQLTLIGPIEPALRPVLARYSHANYLPSLPHERLAPCIRQADIFVMPTIEDGFGLTVPQAMASGLVPIVTDHCGAADIVEEGKSGFIVPAGNTQSLRERIHQLLDNPTQIEAMRTEAIRGVKRWSWENYGRSLEMVFEGLEIKGPMANLG